MSTLLLRLAGPMQSWGTDSRFDLRFTEREPSKSGVVGLVCAALGKPREERPDDGFPTMTELAALRFGVRVDREGMIKVDYHTAGGAHRKGESYGVARASGARGETVQSWRYYLADADFLAGLTGDDALLQRIHAALQRPRWQVCLGRKAFVAALPIVVADAGPASPYWSLPLPEALERYPWDPRSRGVVGQAGRPDRLRLVVEHLPGENAADTQLQMRQDVPLDFAARRFAVRFVHVGSCTPPLHDLAT